ncbi:MAG: N-acetylmuramoyl-L-alanine amidase-like domain-containing protein [bacterium]
MWSKISFIICCVLVFVTVATSHLWGFTGTDSTLIDSRKISFSIAKESSFNDDYQKIILEIKKKKFNNLPLDECIVAIGKLFVGKPYIDKSLETTLDESETVCNLSGFDCVTYFESSWAMATTVKKITKPTYSDYGSQLTNHRYRSGIRKGFQSRLHYTSDYFYDNALRGNLKAMTKSIGEKYAKLETKPINFMTTHPNLYKQLKDDPAMVAKMDSIEKMMKERGGFYFIPKEHVAEIEKGIHGGDLIGITTSIAGIDCSHTGIAVKGDDGRIHFMHASSAMHKVIISPTPLADYLAGNAKQTGIIVYRPLETK